ncbi:MAG: hypothetical protein LBU29_03950 [Endomicrobium sp.]|jgi:ribonuclease HI|nr:hypothetical protein [Endomicrobium sp.]
MTLCKRELQSKAVELQAALKDQNVDILFNDDSFRDYLVKFTINTRGIFLGSLLLYYSPTKNAYSLKKQIKNPEIGSLIDLAWNRLSGCEIYPAKTGIYEAFVDGSYIAGVIGYGAVIYLGTEIKTEISGTIPENQFRQFGGELKSVIETLKWCHTNSVKKIRINYDYQGIEKFATGKWKAKNILSIEYIDFICKAKTEIEWKHIKGHTGNIGNDRADSLAKKAAIVNRTKNM